MTEVRQNLIDQLWRNPTGAAWCQKFTLVCDQTLASIYERVAAQFGGLPVSLVATGGYGRREMAPHSDVDLTVIPSPEAEGVLDQQIRTLFREIHSAFEQLRTPVGYSFRLVSDAPGLDSDSLSGLLDARLIAGDPSPLDALLDDFWESFPTGDFLYSKLTERNEALVRWNDTPLAVEPNLKLGAGGLRDFQIAAWIARVLRRPEPEKPAAYDTALRYRNLLHAVSARPTDVFSRAKQGEIAHALDIDLQPMLSELAEALLVLEQYFQNAWSSLRLGEYCLTPGACVNNGTVVIAKDATLSQAAVGVWAGARLDMAPCRTDSVQFGPGVDAGEIITALSGGERTIANLDHCGLLQQILPELTACRTLMPVDAAHQYSVFEHTLRVLRILDRLESEEGFFGQLRRNLPDAGALYLAALLHDTGKAISDEHHAEIGAETAQAVGQRWGLEPAMVKSVAWLIKNHLLMSSFTRMRDVSHPQTAAELAEVVGTGERLDMLTLLHFADVSAVGEGIWTPVHQSFTIELYERTRDILDALAPVKPDPELRRRRLADMLDVEAGKREIEGFVASLPVNYLLSTDPELIPYHFGLVQRARQGAPTVALSDLPSLHASELTICSPDAPGLLSKLLGAIYAFDLSLIALRAATTRGDAPVALDTFAVSYSGRPIPQTTALQLADAIKSLLADQLQLDDLLSRKGKDPERSQRITRFRYVDAQPGILEIEAPRGRGLAFRLSQVLAEIGANILSAKVSQWASSAAAAFYIRSADSEGFPAGVIQERFSKLV